MSCSSCDDVVTSLSLICLLSSCGFVTDPVFVWRSAYLRSELRVGVRSWANVKQSL